MTLQLCWCIWYCHNFDLYQLTSGKYDGTHCGKVKRTTLTSCELKLMVITTTTECSINSEFCVDFCTEYLLE